MLLASVTLGGCLLEPREAEPPSSAVSVTYLPRSEAKNVWANLQLALNNKGLSGYEEAISDDFHYFPDQNAEQVYPGVFDEWDRDKEIDFVTKFFESGVTISSEMRDEDFVVPDPAGSSEVEWVGVIYYLKVTSTIDNSESRYRASARITFRLESNYWYITEWEDQQRESDPDDAGKLLSSMGDLRGIFGSQ
jgi:hypothetical protein